MFWIPSTQNLPQGKILATPLQKHKYAHWSSMICRPLRTHTAIICTTTAKVDIPITMSVDCSGNTYTKAFVEIWHWHNCLLLPLYVESWFDTVYGHHYFISRVSELYKFCLVDLSGSTKIMMTRCHCARFSHRCADFRSVLSIAAEFWEVDELSQSIPEELCTNWIGTT